MYRDARGHYAVMTPKQRAGRWRAAYPLTDDDGVLDGADGLADVDSDGKANCVDPDSDNDGIYDGTEMGLITSISDNVNNNLTPHFIINGTNISKGYFIIDEDPSTTTDFEDNDTDDDGLLDGIEDSDNNGLLTFGETDPNDKDTDNDGLVDGWIDQMVWNSTSQQFESCNDGTVGTFDQWEGEDWNKNGEVDKDENESLIETNPIMNDTDGDKLGDGDETKPELIKEDNVENSNNYVTNPINSDSDVDGLDDYTEILGLNITVRWEATFEIANQNDKVFSNPNVNDTDNDGLLDGEEFVYGSDPTKSDTDCDKSNDKNEVDINSNPGSIDGVPPIINNIQCWIDPIVRKGSSGVKYLDCVKFKLTLNLSDSIGIQYIEIKTGKNTIKYYFYKNQTKSNNLDVNFNIFLDYPFPGKELILINITDYYGNKNQSEIIPSDYIPNFKNQNWVDPWLHLTRKCYSIGKYAKELPSNLKSDIKSKIEYYIDNYLYKSIKNKYYGIGFTENKAFIQSIDSLSLEQTRYACIALHTFIKIFTTDDFNEIRYGIKQLYYLYDDNRVPRDFKIYLLYMCGKLYWDIKQILKDGNANCDNDLREFISSKSRSGTLANRLINKYAWYLNNMFGLPQIIHKGFGLYRGSGPGNDRDKDYIKNAEELRVIFRSSRNAHGSYNKGWVSISDRYGQLHECGFHKTYQNFKIERDFPSSNWVFLRKGYTFDNKQYLVFKNPTFKITKYMVYIIKKIKDHGKVDITIYRSDKVKSNSYADNSPIPNGAYYFFESRLCPEANPLIKDIFIEVDWMWKGVKEYYFNDECFWFNKENAGKKDKRYLKSETIRDLGKAFKKKGIKIHFDNGCRFNEDGGSPIKFDSRLKRPEGWTIKNSHFSLERDGIYYYCILAHKNGAGSTTNLGRTSAPNDFFTIFDYNCGKVNTHQKREIMHELGHNLIGHWHPGHIDHNPNAKHLKNKDGESSNGREHCMNHCVLKRAKDAKSTRPLNYCSECWAAVRFDGRDMDFTN